MSIDFTEPFFMGNRASLYDIGVGEGSSYAYHFRQNAQIVTKIAQVQLAFNATSLEKLLHISKMDATSK